MKRTYKFYLLRAIISGLVFAAAMWAYDTANGEGFDLTRFIWRFLIYGTGMAIVWFLIDKTAVRKQAKKE